jgi:hypothetical protein
VWWREGERERKSAEGDCQTERASMCQHAWVVGPALMRTRKPEHLAHLRVALLLQPCHEQRLLRRNQCVRQAVIVPAWGHPETTKSEEVSRRAGKQVLSRV